jgi:hypothetical protein
MTKELEPIRVVPIELRDSPEAVRPDVEDPGLEIARLRRHVAIVGEGDSRRRVDSVTSPLG